MARGRVLVIGLDPVRIPGWDPEPVVAAIARGQARFGDHGIDGRSVLSRSALTTVATIAALAASHRLT